MADESNSYSDLISRRRFVELTGVTGAAALAGCGGDGDGTDTPTDGDTGGTDDSTDAPTDDDTPTAAGTFYPDVEHLGVTTVSPSDIQYNPWNSDGAPAISNRLLFEKFAQYSYAAGEFQPAGLTDWTLDGGTFTMTLRDGLTWSNGEPVTADDVVRQFKIAEYDEDPMWNFIESVSAVDDSTVELTVAENTNPVLIESGIFAQRMIAADEETYGSWLSDLEGGTDISELRGMVDDEPVTNGPFAFESKNDDQVSATHVSEVDGAENPWAENINFGQYSFTSYGGNQQRQTALRNLDVDSDFSLALPARVVAGLPDAVEVANYPDVWGFGLWPNHDHEHVGDRGVRQAIAYAINRDLCVQNSLPRAKRAPAYSVAISDVADNQSTWLGDAESDFESYGKAETMTDQVTQVMEDAGYSRPSDGTWQDQDGNTVSLPITVPGGWGDWVAQAETIVSNLQTAGFESSLDTYTGFLDSDNPLKNANFTLGAGPWLHGGPLTHPYFSLVHVLQNQDMANQEVMHSYPSVTEEWGGSSADITVPARGGDGDMTINPIDELQSIATSTDTEANQQTILDLAWVTNVDLPVIPVADKIFQTWLTSDDWTVSENPNQNADAQVQYAPTWLPRQGEMNWKGN